MHEFYLTVDDLEAFYRRAKAIVAVSQGIYNRLVERGIPQEKLVLIPNGSNVELFQHKPELRSRLRKELGLEGRLHFADYVPDELLPDLYAGAGVFVYPSLYEGFGLPVLEAMACGTPVIASNTSALPEIAGDAARLVDPRDVDELARALVEMLSDTALRETFTQKGLAHVKTFSWQATARRVWEAYHSVL